MKRYLHFVVPKLGSGRYWSDWEEEIGQLYGKVAKTAAYQNSGKRRGDRSCTKAIEIVKSHPEDGGRISLQNISVTNYLNFCWVYTGSLSLSVILIGHPCDPASMIVPFPLPICFSVYLNLIQSLWRWRQHVPSKCLYQLTILHGVRIQKVTIWYGLMDKHVMKYKKIQMFTLLCGIYCSKTSFAVLASYLQ
jgi:hypothetical protein